ncbi:MAG: hypothetical protein P8O68_09960, partial [Gammaproteobacteria bacterium]|nr:hypothetical protein [Gammaproteobacteria bacterium]
MLEIFQLLKKAPRLLVCAAIIVLSSMMSFAIEPGTSNERTLNANSLDYLGFDEAHLSDRASEGLREIFSGNMFYSA